MPKPIAHINTCPEGQCVGYSGIWAAATDAERERCAAIVQLAREGEIDTDLRTIISRIKRGDSIATMASNRQRMR